MLRLRPAFTCKDGIGVSSRPRRSITHDGSAEAAGFLPYAGYLETENQRLGATSRARRLRKYRRTTEARTQHSTRWTAPVSVENVDAIAKATASKVLDIVSVGRRRSVWCTP